MHAYMNARTHTNTLARLLHLRYSWHDVAERTTRVCVQPAPPVYCFDSLCMYDILGREQRQGEQEAAGGKESTSLRMHNDVHRVSSMCGVKHVAVVSVG